MADDAEFARGACLRKTPSPSLFHAINRAWIIAATSGYRLAIYPCPVCRKFHLSRDVASTTAVFCTWPMKVNQ